MRALRRRTVACARSKRRLGFRVGRYLRSHIGRYVCSRHLGPGIGRRGARVPDAGGQPRMSGKWIRLCGRRRMLLFQVRGRLLPASRRVRTAGRGMHDALGVLQRPMRARARLAEPRVSQLLPTGRRAVHACARLLLDGLPCRSMRSPYLRSRRHEMQHERRLLFIGLLGGERSL